MADTNSKAARSKIMSAVKGKNTKPEITVRKYLFSQGFRYRKNVSNLPGKPDIVLPKYRTVVFVNGCFWHFHQECNRFVWPEDNADYWKKKITGNIERDKRNYKALCEAGWKVIVVWECQLKKNQCEETLTSLAKAIRGNAL